jgi:DNA-directed RNA polymerase specialized sigma24 family protein
MSANGSVTHWIGRLKGGDALAAQKLWEGYFQQLVRLARQRLRSAPRRAADEEDVALSAFDSFCRGAEQGRFPRLSDRDDLWQLLVVLTARKACNLVHYESRDKRDWRRTRSGDVPPGGDPDAEATLLSQVIGREPAPDFALQVAERCEHLLARLGDPDLRAIALWKMEGYTNDEIADKLGRSRPTVERKLQRIRGIWESEAGHGNHADV